MTTLELAMKIRGGNVSAVEVADAIDDYLAAREAEMLPKLLAAMLEPEAVGKLRDALGRHDVIKLLDDECQCGHTRGKHEDNDGQCCFWWGGLNRKCSCTKFEESNP